MKKPYIPQRFSPAFYAGSGLLLAITVACCAGGLPDRPRRELTDVNSSLRSKTTAEDGSLDAILKQLNQKTAELKSYQCRIEYLFSQPLFESQTLRTGRLYYQKAGRESKLRMNFQTLKQDDADQQKYIEHYFFDGVWLTHIDYQTKTVKRYQMAEPNKPADAFDLASKNFPIIGFTKIEDLKEQFVINLIEQNPGEPNDFLRLHLIVKPDSIYRNDYASVEFWIDKKLYLPAKIIAVSTEGDIYQLTFFDAKVNEKIDKELFEFKIPEGFDKEIIPLKKKDK
jgi:outer membrane lipoprotein-sorting protein